MTSAKTICIAVDFGTANTGYSYSLNSRTQPIFELFWPDGDGAKYPKAPSDLLYDGEGNMKHWGYSAKKQLFEMEDIDEIKKHSLLSHYKLALLTPTEEVTDTHGKKYSAKRLIVDYLKQLLQKIQADIAKVSVRNFAPQEIQWVFTIPSGYEERTKNTMKSLIHQAGFTTCESPSESELMLVYEPEGAIVYCLKKMEEDEETMKNGETVMVIDAGGGTVDLTAHTLRNGRLVEATIRNNGILGSSKLDEKFLDLMRTKLGPTFNQWENSDLAARWELLKEWEDKKKVIESYEAVVRMNTPFALMASAKQVPGFYMASSNKFKLEQTDVKNIFEPVVSGICKLVHDQLEQMTKSSLQPAYVFLVGGLGQNKLLQKEVEKLLSTKVPGCKLVCPPFAGEAVLGGAALLGLDSSLIRTRKSTKTYGINVNVEANAETCQLYKASKQRYDEQSDSFYFCDIFHPLVQRGDPVDFDEERSFEFSVAPYQSSIDVDLFCTESNPKHIDEDQVFKMTTVSVPVTSSSNVQQFKMTLQFGKADLKIKVTTQQGAQHTATCTFHAAKM